MFDAWVFLVALLLMAGSAAYGAYRWWRDQQRTALLRQFCLAKGWAYRLTEISLTSRWFGPPFFQGSRRRARNVVRGGLPSTTAQLIPPLEFVAFDYTYMTEHGTGTRHKSRATHRYAICAIELPTYLPALTVTPENVLSRMGGALSTADVELESEDFNRRFVVQCPDPKFASDVLTPRTMHLLLSRRPLHVRIEGKDLVCWEEGQITPNALLERTSTLAALVQGIPSFVWRDYGVAASPEGVAS